MTLSYRAKKHEPGTRDFAVFDDGTYIGDAIAVFKDPVRPSHYVRKHEKITPLHVPVWEALPAGEAWSLAGNDDPTLVRFRFESRADAAHALRLRRKGWTANQIAGFDPRPEDQ